MKTGIIISGMLCLLSGCGPRHKDTSHLNLAPGIGVEGVVEIGMTHAEVSSRTRDLVVHRHESPPWEYEVPSLGASWQSGGECSNDPLGVFVVFVGPAGTGGVSRFNGWFHNTLPLTNGTLITEEQIKNLFGEPVQTYDLSANVFSNEQGSQRYADLRASLATNRQSSIIIWSGDRMHQLGYPTKGVSFFCETNTVNAIVIGRPAEQSAPPLPPAPAGPLEGAR
jgi:hypothetical protein